MKPINVEKSIERNKIVFHEDWLDKTTFLLGNVLIILFLFTYTIFVFIWLFRSISLLLAFIFLVLGLTFTVYIIFSIINNKKLKKIKRKPKGNNIYDVLNYIKEKKWIVLRREKNYIEVNIHDKFSGFHNGRNMYIIFSKKDILINSSTVGHSGNLLPFHWFGNRKVENEFRKEFELYEK